MAILHLADGTDLIELSPIQRELLQLDIQLNPYPLKKSSKLLKLLSQPQLNDVEKKEVLRFYAPLFEILKSKNGYVIHYLLVFFAVEPTPEPPAVISKSFSRQSDGDGYYVIDGAGFFEFSGFWGKSLELTLEAEEHLAIPPGVQYSFRLPSDRPLKLIRYLTNPNPANYSVFHTTEVPFEF